MLETEEIDDDYFTPASSTSLANIFGKSSKEDRTENETLKYTPPKPVKTEETKATQCIYACVLLGYEWSHGAYVPKGKLGFALLKIVKTGIHNMVLYDSSKTTLSCAIISTVFEVTVKENVYLSYHDNQQKYWSLNATEDETKKIVDLLKSLSVVINYSSNEDKSLPLTNSAIRTISEKEEKESDTDSSVNRRTKISILNRMASMGQSVLPIRSISTEKTSDSSDTNDTSNYKIVRHKPVKSSMKRNSSDKNLPECQSLIEADRVASSIIDHSNNSVPLFTYVNGQLVPVTNTNVVTSPSNASRNDLSLLVSEQRMNNSELRININRMTDKFDQILGKLSNLDHVDKTEVNGSFQMDILQKLLREYETKIKMYEALFKSQELDKQFGTQVLDIVFPTTSKETKSEHQTNIDVVKKLEQLNKEKDDKIIDLESEVRALQDKFDDSIKKQTKCTEQLQKELEVLKQELDKKNTESTMNVNQCDVMSQRNEDDKIGNKIKDVMNDTFRAIGSNFENNEQYSGERVKAVTATIIKKVTIEYLNNL